MSYLVLHHGWVVSGDVVTETNGGQGDEDKVDAVEERPLRLQDPEESGGYQDGEQEVQGAHQSKMDQANLNREFTDMIHGQGYLPETYPYWDTF